MKRKPLIAAAIFAEGMLAALHASAHTGAGLRGGLVAGALHPWTGFDHLLAMVAVGLWGAFLERRLAVALPIAFPLMMVAGAALGMRATPLPPVQPAIATSVLVLGTCIACAWRAPAWLALTIVGVFALFHGYAHGRELPSAADPIGYSAGFVVATGLLHVGGIAFAELATRVPRLPLTRVAGAAIAAAGIAFLDRSLGP
ncbi:HupE/UreJ family protein [Dokdonella sp.]|uniref:HupE/UreJ family protein n=1 Tax=Dokdonella sp. TaxID=2291710 RepID=UPI002F404A4B